MVRATTVEALLALANAGGCATAKQVAAALRDIGKDAAFSRLETAARWGLAEKHLVSAGGWRSAVAVWCLPGAPPGKIFAAAWSSVSRINFRHVMKRFARLLNAARGRTACLSTADLLPEDASVKERVVLFEMIRSLDGYGVKLGRIEKWCVKDPWRAAEQVLRWMEEASAPPPPLPVAPPSPKKNHATKRRKTRSGVPVEVRLPRVFKRLAGVPPRLIANAAVARLLSMYDGQPPPKPELPKPLFPNVVTLSPRIYKALRERAEKWGWGVEEVLQTALWLYVRRL